uniref:uncharacterized protein n=1 Tax=Myxine glutinosa TaxID=7769 RepID=UPI00358FA050
MNGSPKIMDVCNAISMTLQCLARPTRIFDNATNPDLNLHSSLNTSSSTSSIASSSHICSPCHSRCLSSTSVTGPTSLDLSHLGLSSLPRLVLSQGSTPNAHLRDVLVYGNRLEELPQEMFLLPRLERLNVSDNELSCISPSLGSLACLQYLDISRNDLTDIPSSARQCRALCSLLVGQNPLCRVPEVVMQLPRLTELGLNSCRLEFLPAAFARLSRLRSIDLRGNNLISLPQSLERLKQLERLDLGDNEFTTVPIVLTQLLTLHELWLDGNELHDIPKEFGALNQLTYLDIANDSLQTLDTSFGACRSLVQLLLSANSLNILPDSIGNLCKLVNLRLDCNQLTALPGAVGDLLSLVELDVSNNQLETLPSSLSNLNRLVTLNVSGNRLCYLPPSLCCCFSLRVLLLGENRLLELPSNLGTLRALRILSLPNNRIKYLPLSLAQLVHLEALWLSLNQVKPLPPLQSDWDETSSSRVLTCYLLPQQDKTEEEEILEEDASHNMAKEGCQEETDREDFKQRKNNVENVDINHKYCPMEVGSEGDVDCGNEEGQKDIKNNGIGTNFIDKQVIDRDICENKAREQRKSKCDDEIEKKRDDGKTNGGKGKTESLVDCERESDIEGGMENSVEGEEEREIEPQIKSPLEGDTESLSEVDGKPEAKEEVIDGQSRSRDVELEEENMGNMTERGEEEEGEEIIDKRRRVKVTFSPENDISDKVSTLNRPPTPHPRESCQDLSSVPFVENLEQVNVHNSVHMMLNECASTSQAPRDDLLSVDNRHLMDHEAHNSNHHDLSQAFPICRTPYLLQPVDDCESDSDEEMSVADLLPAAITRPAPRLLHLAPFVDPIEYNNSPWDEAPSPTANNLATSVRLPDLPGSQPRSCVSINQTREALRAWHLARTQSTRKLGGPMSFNPLSSYPLHSANLHSSSQSHGLTAPSRVASNCPTSFEISSAMNRPDNRGNQALSVFPMAAATEIFHPQQETSSLQCEASLWSHSEMQNQHSPSDQQSFTPSAKVYKIHPQARAKENSRLQQCVFPKRNMAAKQHKIMFQNNTAMLKRGSSIMQNDFIPQVSSTPIQAPDGQHRRIFPQHYFSIPCEEKGQQHTPLQHSSREHNPPQFSNSIHQEKPSGCFSVQPFKTLQQHNSPWQASAQQQAKHFSSQHHNRTSQQQLAAQQYSRQHLHSSPNCNTKLQHNTIPPTYHKTLPYHVLQQEHMVRQRHGMTEHISVQQDATTVHLNPESCRTKRNDIAAQQRFRLQHITAARPYNEKPQQKPLQRYNSNSQQYPPQACASPKQYHVAVEQQALRQRTLPQENTSLQQTVGKRYGLTPQQHNSQYLLLQQPVTPPQHDIFLPDASQQHNSPQHTIYQHCAPQHGSSECKLTPRLKSECYGMTVHRSDLV